MWLTNNKNKLKKGMADIVNFWVDMSAFGWGKGVGLSNSCEWIIKFIWFIDFLVHRLLERPFNIVMCGHNQCINQWQVFSDDYVNLEIFLKLFSCPNDLIEVEKWKKLKFHIFSREHMIFYCCCGIWMTIHEYNRAGHIVLVIQDGGGWPVYVC